MPPFTVLTVCVGNVCRSPLVERLLRLRLDGVADRAVTVDSTSAGVRARVGAPMHPLMKSALRDLGGDSDGFAARQLTVSMLQSADLVLTATSGVRSRVLEEAPGALRRTFTILELAALTRSSPTGLSAAALVADAAERRSSIRSERDVPDPINRSPEVFAAVAAQLDEATRTIATALAASRPQDT